MTDSQEHPISYLYTSSDESVLTVDENGLVEAVGEGKATITVALEQNESKFTDVEIEVPAAQAEYIGWTVTLPPSLKVYSSMLVSAAIFQNGVATDDPVDITFSGPEATAYATIPGNEPNTYRVTAYYASPIPLTITAKSGGYTLTANVALIT